MDQLEGYMWQLKGTFSVVKGEKEQNSTTVPPRLTPVALRFFFFFFFPSIQSQTSILNLEATAAICTQLKKIKCYIWKIPTFRFLTTNVWMHGWPLHREHQKGQTSPEAWIPNTIQLCHLNLLILSPLIKDVLWKGGISIGGKIPHLLWAKEEENLTVKSPLCL